MTANYQQLRDHYQSVAYGKNNVLDGKFKGMMTIYDRMYLRFMPPKPAKVADIACGGGQFSKWCDNHGYEVVGVDLSREQIEYCKTGIIMALPENQNSFHLMDGMKLLEDNPNTYDVVCANDFIEHITKAQGIEFVRLVYQALKPNGRILMKTFNAAAFGGLTMWCNALDHECGYTERSLDTLLGINGFKDIEIIPYKDRRRAYNWSQTVSGWVLGKMYKYIYSGNYPKYYGKIIGVTGVKKDESPLYL